jgi:tetratricopeptide (TPR) repeat protein
LQEVPPTPEVMEHLSLIDSNLATFNIGTAPSASLQLAETRNPSPEKSPMLPAVSGMNGSGSPGDPLAESQIIYSNAIALDAADAEVPPEDSSTSPPDINSLLLKLASYEQLGNCKQGLPTVERALAQLPDQEHSSLDRAYLNSVKANLLYVSGKFSSASDTLEQAVLPVIQTRQSHPLYEPSWFNAHLLRVLIQLRQCHPKGFETVELLQNHPQMAQPPFQWQLVWSDVLLSQGQYDAAQAVLMHQTPANRWEHDALTIAQCRILAEQHDWSALLGKAEPGTHEKQNPLLMTASHRFKGRALHGLGQMEKARQALEQALVLSLDHHYQQDSLITWRYLADLALHQGDNHNALVIVEQALTIATQPAIQATYERYLLEKVKAHCLLELGQLQAAGQQLEPLWAEVKQTRQPSLIAQYAEQIGIFYGYLCESVKDNDEQARYRDMAVMFLQRSRDIWAGLNNSSQTQRIEKTIACL